MKRYEMIVVGAGPAGLSAAIEAAKCGMDVALFDENARPGGQLFKQIHKFFGSKEHHAKTRGARIGRDLLAEAEQAGVHAHLNATVVGIYDDKEVLVNEGGEVDHVRGDFVLICTGAAENALPFKGWDKPGVIGAGAAQALMNLQGVQPGQRVLMVGSGNVGLIVSFQLMQAGCTVVGLVEAAPRVGGYGVHASKLTRAGVPILTSHTVVEATGDACATGATIAQVDSHFQPIPGTEEHLDVDTICIAIGLTPMSQLAITAGCAMEFAPRKGGNVPVIDGYNETSIPGIYCCGDVAGIDEASSAMLLGRISAAHAAMRAGYLDEDAFNARLAAYHASLDRLHDGMFAPQNKGRTDIVETSDGYPLSKTLLAKGYLDDAELANFPAASSHQVGIHPMIECTQEIPCDPCQDACAVGCIKVGDRIVKLPVIDGNVACTGCGLCVASCPGQAIFLVDNEADPDFATVSFPYEFLPRPQKGDVGTALGRDGRELCRATITNVRMSKKMDKTAVVTMRVPAAYADTARFFRA